MDSQLSRTPCFQPSESVVEPHPLQFPIVVARIVRRPLRHHSFLEVGKAGRAHLMSNYQLFVQSPADGCSFARCIGATSSMAEFVSCGKRKHSLASQFPAERKISDFDL